jgi:hypothetical protein
VALKYSSTDEATSLARNPEPQRTILNFHIDDAHAVAAHLHTLAVTWLVEVEFRGDPWFRTLLDPDGNCIQIIELTNAYWEARRWARPLSSRVRSR